MAWGSVLQAESAGFAAELDVRRDRKLEIGTVLSCFCLSRWACDAPRHSAALEELGEDRRGRESHQATRRPSLPQRGRPGERWLSESVLR